MNRTPSLHSRALLLLTFTLGVGCGCEPETSERDRAEIPKDCVTDAAAICEAAMDWNIRCGEYGEADRSSRYDKCVERSPAQFNCPFARSFESCLTTLGCDSDNEKCIFEALLDAEPEGWDVKTMASCIDGTIEDEAVCKRAIGDGPTRTCLNRYNECKAASEDGYSPFVDDRCYTLGSLSATAIATGVECLSLGCSEIGACLSATGAFSY